MPRSLRNVSETVLRALMQIADELRSDGLFDEATTCDGLSGLLSRQLLDEDVNALCDAAGSIARDVEALGEVLLEQGLEGYAHRCTTLQSQLTRGVHDALAETQPIELARGRGEDES